MRTATEWFEVYEAGDLPVEAAKVWTPREWEHKVGHYGEWICVKCRKTFRSDKNIPCTCSVPDPIVIDWNTAMEWRDRAVEQNLEAWETALHDVCCAGRGKYDSIDRFMEGYIQPHHYIIAAILAKENV